MQMNAQIIQQDKNQFCILYEGFTKFFNGRRTMLGINMQTRQFADFLRSSFRQLTQSNREFFNRSLEFMNICAGSEGKGCKILEASNTYEKASVWFETMDHRRFAIHFFYRGNVGIENVENVPPEAIDFLEKHGIEIVLTDEIGFGRGVRPPLSSAFSAYLRELLRACLSLLGPRQK